MSRSLKQSNNPWYASCLFNLTPCLEAPTLPTARHQTHVSRHFSSLPPKSPTPEQPSPARTAKSKQPESQSVQNPTELATVFTSVHECGEPPHTLPALAIRAPYPLTPWLSSPSRVTLLMFDCKGTMNAEAHSE
eukprot:1160453-Pelagomonas_calceolata.AAC.17